nr:MAG TPA: hypothetical protein [Caudoviricetes sp.]
MTNQEKMEKYNALTAELLKQQGIMRKSDAHAIKCQKLGLDFKQVYPDEFITYYNAREAYNKAEQELAELKLVEPKEEVYHEEDFR